MSQGLEIIKTNFFVCDICSSFLLLVGPQGPNQMEDSWFGSWSSWNRGTWGWIVSIRCDVGHLIPILWGHKHLDYSTEVGSWRAEFERGWDDHPRPEAPSLTFLLSLQGFLALWPQVLSWSLSSVALDPTRVLPGGASFSPLGLGLVQVSCCCWSLRTSSSLTDTFSLHVAVTHLIICSL